MAPTAAAVVPPGAGGIAPGSNISAIMRQDNGRGKDRGGGKDYDWGGAEAPVEVRQK